MTARCGVPTRLAGGRPCHQPVDVWPCRYHDKASFDALMARVTDAVRDHGGWAGFLNTLAAGRAARGGERTG